MKTILAEIEMLESKIASVENYDDFGDGKYDHMPIAKRIPLHADKAEEFLRKGDYFNAASHARAVLSLGAAGYIGTPPYKRAEAVLKKIPHRSEWKRG